MPVWGSLLIFQTSLATGSTWRRDTTMLRAIRPLCVSFPSPWESVSEIRDRASYGCFCSSTAPGGILFLTALMHVRIIASHLQRISRLRHARAKTLAALFDRYVVNR